MAAPDFLKNLSSFDVSMFAGRLFDFNAALTRVTGDITLDRRYRGGIILFDSAAGGTITLPSGLVAGFNVSVLQINTGQATMAAGAGAVLQSQQSFTKTAGQWAMIGILAYDTGSYVLVGNGA